MEAIERAKEAIATGDFAGALKLLVPLRILSPPEESHVAHLRDVCCIQLWDFKAALAHAKHRVDVERGHRPRSVHHVDALHDLCKAQTGQGVPRSSQDRFRQSR
jgi:hypothetical protein